MTSVSLFAMVRQILRCDSFFSSNGQGYEGRAVRVEAACKRLRIILDTGRVVTWALGQATVDNVAAMFAYMV